MKNATRYLEAVKARHGGASDYRAAKILGVTTSAVSKWRNGTESFSPTTAKKVAEELGIDEEIVVIESQIDRCKSPEEAAIWQRVLRRLGGAAAAVVAFSVIGLAPMDTQAASPYPAGMASKTLFIM